MSRSRILFRADASAELGFGHVARVCALIEEAEAQGHEAVAMFDGDRDAIRAWAGARGLAVHPRAWTTAAVVAEACHPQVRGLVIDGPELARSLLPELPRGVETIVLDDAGEVPFAMTAVVNHNHHACELAPSYPNARRRLLGRRYLMLRRDIRRHPRGACRPANRSRLRVAISFGGSDPVNATARTLRLLPTRQPLDVIVIAGPGYRGGAELRDAVSVARGADHVVDVRCAPADPGALFVGVDAAICSAGGTLGELAYLGCPALAYAIARDQLAPARSQATGGLVSGGRDWGQTDDASIAQDIRDFVGDDAQRAVIRQRALSTVDADGARRVIEEGLAR